jgi:hypothetical protein
MTGISFPYDDRKRQRQLSRRITFDTRGVC